MEGNGTDKQNLTEIPTEAKDADIERKQKQKKP